MPNEDPRARRPTGACRSCHGPGLGHGTVIRLGDAVVEEPNAEIPSGIPAKKP